MMKYLKPVLILSVFTFLAGCADTYTPGPSRPLDPITEFTSTNTISLQNGQPSKDEVTVYDYPLQKSIRGDLNAWTDVAIDIASRELKKRGMSIAGQSPKWITMSIVSAHTETGMVRIETQIVMHVTASDGYVATYVGKNSSVMAANLHRQIDGAVMRVVHEMLEDRHMVAFLVN